MGHIITAIMIMIELELIILQGKSMENNITFSFEVLHQGLKGFFWFSSS